MNKKKRSMMKFMLSSCWSDGAYLFSGDFTTSLAYKGKGVATFTRASAKVFTDHEGNLIRTPTSNEATFTGARRVRNLLADNTSEDFSVASWTKVGTATVTGTNVINFPTVNDLVSTASTTYFGANQTAVWSVVLSGSGSISLQIYHANGGGTTVKQVSLTSTPTRYALSKTYASTVPTSGTYVYIVRIAGDTATQVTATNAQLEEVTAQTIQTPGEYVSTHTAYDGQTVKGVRYFDYANGNTVDANGVVTEVQGAALTTLKGFAYDPATTNKHTGYNMLGPDLVSSTELITVEADRTFASDTGWWTKGAGWSIGGGVATWTHGSGSAALSRAGLVSPGRRYRINYDVISNTTTASALILLAVGSPVISSTVGTGKTADFTPNDTFFFLYMSGGSGGAISFDNVSIKEIQGANSSGTGVSGLGVGARAFYASSWQQGITGLTAGGATDGYAEVVSDTAKVTSGKLLRLIPSGKVIKLVAGAAGANTFDFSGVLSAATHTVSAYIRGNAVTDTVQLGGSVTGVEVTPQALTTEYQVISAKFTAQATDVMRIQVPAGQTVYVCLQQAEALEVPTLPVLVEGATASRSRDALTWPVADGVNFRQREGTLSADVTWGFASTVVAGLNLISINGSSGLLLYTGVLGGNYRLISLDSTNTPIRVISPFTQGDTQLSKVSWSTAKNALNVYGAGGWATKTAYDGSYPMGTVFAVGTSSAYPLSISNIRVLGTADPAGVQ